jgi:hypothetical protein
LIEGKVADLRRKIAEPGSARTPEMFFMEASERAGLFVEAMRGLVGEG